MDNLLDFKGGKGLHFINGNIRSMFNKFDQLKQYLLDSNITFLGLSETWLNGNIPSSMLYVPGYQLFRLDRAWVNAKNQIKKGGGLCCYTNGNCNFSNTELMHMNLSNCDGEVQHMVLQQPKMKKCIIVNVYRPPQGNVASFVNLLIENVNDITVKYPNTEITIMGDFNVDMNDKNNPNYKHMKWLERATGLKQHGRLQCGHEW